MFGLFLKPLYSCVKISKTVANINHNLPIFILLLHCAMSKHKFHYNTYISLQLVSKHGFVQFILGILV